MTSQLNLNRFIVVLLTTAPILAILGFVNLSLDLGKPFGGFTVMYVTSLNQWDVEAGCPTWWFGVTKGGLKTHDHLISMANQPFNVNYPHIFATAYSKGQRSIAITIEREGEILVKQVPIAPITLAHLLDWVVPRWITGLCFWILAIVIYRSQPDNLVNQIFAIAMGLFAGHQWVFYNTIFEDSSSFTRLYNLSLFVIFTGFLGPLTIYFSLIFPIESLTQRNKFLLRLACDGALLAMISFALGKIIRWHYGYNDLVGWLDGTGYRGMVLLTIGGIVFLVSRYSWLLTQKKLSSRVKRQCQMIIVGILISSPPLSLIFLEAFLGGTTGGLFWSTFDLRYLWIATPLGFTYAIIRYQTFQNTNRFFNFVLIMAASAIFANFVDATWRQFQPELNDLAVIPPFIPLFTLTCAFGTFATFYSSLSGPLAQIFHRDTISYEAVNQFGQRLLGNSNLRNLPLQIAQSLINELHLEKAAVWLWQADKEQFVLAGWAGEWQPSTSAEFPPHEFELLEPLLNPNDKTQYLGYLALGKRWDEEIFDPRDRTIANLIAQQASLFLLTAMQITELRYVPQRITEAQERERYKLAQELHDTIQQFLGRLPFYLEVSRSAVSQAPARAEAILQQCIDDVAVASRELRFIRHNLATEQLAKGLTQPVTDLVQRLRLRYHLTIELTIDSQVDPLTDLEARQALYRVVQQSLDNIVNHAKATQVTVVITVTNQQVQIHITDNGIGFSPQRRAQAKEGGHFGLASMESRLTSLGGELQIVSTVGQGTQVVGWLPGHVL